MKTGHVISSCLLATVLGTVAVAGRLQRPTPEAPAANREETRSTPVPHLPPVTVTPPIVETTPSTTPAGTGGDNALLRSLVERATGYVEDVQRLLPSIVVEEQYLQVITRWSGEALKVAQAPMLESQHDESELSSRGVLRRRQLVSDVLLIQMAGKAWVGYRDVAEVDGKPVRDRSVRLQKLFMSSSAGDRRQMQRIADESARLNLGPRRNINTPTFPLWILTAQNVSRFAWALASPDPAAPCCAVVDFREATSPTIVSTDQKRDVPLSGRFWIEPGTGRVRQALLTFAERREHLNGWFNVHYGPLPDFDVLVPVSMSG